MNKREKIVLAVAVALAMTSSGLAFGSATTNSSSDQVIYACVTGVNGNIVKVSSTQKTCPRGTTPISWNMVGPKGDTGATGEKGQKGDQGEQGIPGDGGGVNSDPGGRNYLVSPDGQVSLPLVSVPLITSQPVVKIDGLYWAVGGEELSAIHWVNEHNFHAFTTEDCTGTKLTALSNYRMFHKNLVASFSFQQEAPFYKVEQSSVLLQDIKSFSASYVYGAETTNIHTGCLPVNSGSFVVPSGNYDSEYELPGYAITDIDFSKFYKITELEKPAPLTGWYLELR